MPCQTLLPASLGNLALSVPPEIAQFIALRSHEGPQEQGNLEELSQVDITSPTLPILISSPFA
jgi:hypothetical protein